jgi:very-short-patch-repair endonuclease
VEAIVGRLASSQHGVVTRAQLLRAGVTLAELEHRLGTGTLLPVHRGVYRVGHRAPSVEARYLAAVLAGGEGALLVARAAAHLFGLIKAPAPPPEVATRTERRIPGVKTQRRRHLEEGTRWRGIPVTTVAQTLVDIAAHLPLDALARACHEAGVRYRTTPAQVDAVLRRHPRVKGAGKLRPILHGDTRVTLSKLEKRFLKLLQEHRLPPPRTNRPAGTKRVECRWPDHNLTVELDSYRFHNSRHAWEQDRQREREAYARGDAFRRYTWSDVFENSNLMLAQLRDLLRSRRPGTPPRR